MIHIHHSSLLFGFTVIAGLSILICSTAVNSSLSFIRFFVSSGISSDDASQTSCQASNHVNDAGTCNEEEVDGAAFYNHDFLPWLGLCALAWLFWLAKTQTSLQHEKSSNSRLPFTALVSATLFLLLSTIIDQDYFAIIKSLSHLSGWYLNCLDESPLITKSATTGLIQVIGDYCAQVFEEYRIRKAEKQSSRTGLLFKIPDNYDLRRGLSLLADGMLLSGPLLHYAFDWLEHLIPTTEGQATIAAIIHVLVNDYIIDSIYLFLSFVFVPIAEGHNILELVDIFKKDFFPTIKASLSASLAFVPLEFIIFRYLSVPFRVLAMNFIDILWGAIISFVAHRSRREAKETSSVENYRNVGRSEPARTQYNGTEHDGDGQ